MLISKLENDFWFNMIIFYIILSFLLVFSFFSIVVWTLRNGISPMPTGRKAKKAILQLIHENFNTKAQGNILELGSGFLTLALPINKQFPEKKIIAFETSTIPYLFSKLLGYFCCNDNLMILKKNFFISDFTNASLIVCYLYPGAMAKLKEKFEKELKSGTFIISNTFAIPGWKPIKTLTINDLYHTKIYLYKKN